MFRSPREALGYMYAAERGPGLARLNLGKGPRDTGRTAWDHVLIAAMLRGPTDTGCCGVGRDSALDLELRLWATQPGQPRSLAVRRIERVMRRLMRDAGVKVDVQVPKVIRLTWQDNQGNEHTSAMLLREAA